MTLDFTKPMQTRRGLSARFLGELKGGTIPYYVFAITHEDGKEHILTVNANTYHPLGYDWDIINVPENVERWLNLYAFTRHQLIDLPAGFVGHRTREDAERFKLPHRSDLVKVIISPEGKFISAESVL